MEALITYIIKGLVEKTDQVELRATSSEGSILYELKVAPEDVGKVIGRDGRTVNAIRTLLSTAAQKKGLRARLDVLDDRRSAVGARPSNGLVSPPVAPEQ